MPTPQDYSQYSLPELYNLAHDFDGEEQPEKYAEIQQEIEKRKRGESRSAKPYTPAGTLVVVLGIAGLILSPSADYFWSFLCLFTCVLATTSLRTLEGDTIADVVERNNLVIGRSCAIVGIVVFVFRFLSEA